MASIVGSVAQEQGGFLSPTLNYSVSNNLSLRCFEQAGGRKSKHQKHSAPIHFCQRHGFL